MSQNHMTVCHLWANGSKDSAKGFNVYFEGREIYSYGSHFMLGYRMGPSLFFLNSSGYSISTSKHKSYVWRAAHGEIFHVPNLTRLRWELQTIAGYREGKRDKADARRAGARIIETLAPAIGADTESETVSRDAVERLALESGFTAKQAAAAINKAMRAAADKAEANKRRLAAADRAEAIAGAKVKPATWAADIATMESRIRNAASDYDRRNAVSTLEYSAKEAARLHRQATRAKLGKRTVAALWAIVKAHKAALADHAAKAAKREALGTFAALAKRFRDNLAKVADMPDSVERPGYRFGTYDAIYRDGCALSHVRHVAGWPDMAAKVARLTNDAYAKAQAEAAEAAAAAAARDAEKIARWRAGEAVAGFYRESPHGGAMIRARAVERDESGAIVGGMLETSQGASVPLAHAIRVFRFLKLMRERGESWERNGRTIRVGHYTVDRVGPDGGFTAGCHRFAWAEIETLAESLGVFEIAPADVRETSH